MGKDQFYKKRPNDKVWWVREMTFDKDGYLLPTPGDNRFSFDHKHIFDLFRDYPYKLTPEQIEIFDKENPFWADFFKSRKVKHEGIDVSKN